MTSSTTNAFAVYYESFSAPFLGKFGESRDYQASQSSKKRKFLDFLLRILKVGAFIYISGEFHLDRVTGSKVTATSLAHLFHRKNKNNMCFFINP